MRIIAGRWKGKRFDPPRAFRGRPTTDYAREALFNVLTGKVEFSGLRVLDLFSGTGAFSYECHSRGAEHIVAVDHSAVSARYIPGIFNELGMEEARFVKADVFEFLKRSRQQFDLVLADPPFEAPFIEALPQQIMQSGALAEEGLLVLEHGPGTKFGNGPEPWLQKQYGHVHFSFFRNSQA